MKNKKIKLIILIIPVMLLLTGCGTQVPITNDPSGIWDTIVFVLAKIIIFFGIILGNNIGWGLVVTTILFRLVLVPLYRTQLKNTEQMQIVQPEIKKIQSKYANKSDAAAKQKMNQEIQALYTRYNVNPLAGCLPLFIQLPLLFMFYDAIQGLLINGLYQKPPTHAWQGMINLGAENMHRIFLGVNLDKSSIIFAILAAFTTWFTTFISMKTQNVSPNDNPSANIMKPMMIIMPIMILFMGMQFPAALSLYWIVGNVVMIVQTVIFKRHILFDNNKNKIMKK